jgi:hypothetical protein
MKFQLKICSVTFPSFLLSSKVLEVFGLAKGLSREEKTYRFYEVSRSQINFKTSRKESFNAFIRSRNHENARKIAKYEQCLIP